jgi:hypothetical protein
MDLRTLLDPWIAAGLVAAVGLLVVISLADGVRTALLAAAICAIAVATGVRYAPLAALALLALVALVALTGSGPGSDDRPPRPAAAAATAPARGR